MDATVVLLYVEKITAVFLYIYTWLGTTTGSWKILVGSWKSPGIYFGQDRGTLLVSLSLCASVCLSVCPVRALNFESLDLETSLLVCRYVFRISRSCSYIKIISQGQGQRRLKVKQA